MEKGIIVQLHGDFEKSVYTDQEGGMDFWLARDLQKLLGYAKWENFAKVIEKAKISCKNADFELSDHFLDVRKMVEPTSTIRRHKKGRTPIALRTKEANNQN